MSIIQRAYTKLVREGHSLMDQSLGLAGLYSRHYRLARGCRIIVYHGICRRDPTRFNPIFITQKTLERHLRFYKQYFHTLSLEAMYRKEFSNDRFNVCLTFDDGFANNYSYALPLLEQYQVPAAFFITGIRAMGYDILWNDFLNIITRYGPAQLEYKNRIYYKNRYRRYVSAATGMALADELRASGFAAKKEMMETLAGIIDFRNIPGDRDYWMQLEEAEIKALAASSMATIGCHGYYHNDLSAISAAEVREELLRSKQFLEKVTGKPITALAFPYGSYSPAVIGEAKQAGFTRLLATDFTDAAAHADASMRERFTVNPFIPVHAQLLATIKGKYDRWA